MERGSKISRYTFEKDKKDEEKLYIRTECGPDLGDDGSRGQSGLI